jgi:protein-L-isoaspartate(D-aspartate) O-methyltransferase
MTQYLKVSPGEKVLEIGTGSGYQAAVLAELTDNVYTIEIKKRIFEKAGSRLKNIGYHNIKLKHGDGYLGWSEHAPFDAIIITAAVNKIPPLLVKQLKIGGRILLPLGRVLTLVTKKEKELTSRRLMGVIFDRMTGMALE